MAIQFFLNEIFNANATTMQGIEVARGPPAMQALHNNAYNSLANVSAQMRNMTNAMTMYMRTNGAPWNNAPGNGTVISTTTCIAVHWLWLTIPAGLGGMSILFLVATLGNIFTKSRDLNWKSSILPYMFHGVDVSFQERYGNINQLDRMKEFAKQTKVQLAETPEGWRLIEAHKLK